MAILSTGPDNPDSDDENVKTTRGRQSIIKHIRGDTKDMDKDQKLQLLESLCGSESPILLAPVELFKVYHVLKSFNSAWNIYNYFDMLLTSVELPPRNFDNEDDDQFDLSSAYAALCSRMYRTDDILQFSLIAEILEDMLRTKVGSWYTLHKPFL